MSTELIIYNYRSLSQLTGLKEQTLRLWVSKEIGPVPTRIGRAVRFRHEDVEAWLERLREPPEPPKRGRGRPKGSKNKKPTTTTAEG